MDGKPCDLTVDTGAERTFVQSGVAAAPNPPVAREVLCGVTGDCVELKGPVTATVEVAGAEERMPVYVADVGENLLGLDYLQRAEAVLDFGKQTLEAGGSVVPLGEGHGGARVSALENNQMPLSSEAGLRCHLSKEIEMEGRVGSRVQLPLQGVGAHRTLSPPRAREVHDVVTSASIKACMVPVGCAPDECEEVVQAGSPEGQGETLQESSTEVPPFLRDLQQRSTACLTEQQAVRVERLLVDYADVFSQGDHDLGRTSLVKHHIHTGNCAPIKEPPRRIAPARRDEVERAVNELWSQGVIEKSSSPWSSAIVPVKKKDGSTRVCVDYRSLNAVTTKDSYPLPRIDDTLDALEGAQWFSTLDLKSGYHQVEMVDEDKPKTAFSYGQGLWQFRVMSFGLVNAPATFERLMERVLDGLLWKSALVYLDDVVVYGGSFEATLERLEAVLKRFRESNLKLSPKKCCLFQRQVPFLGHIVSGDGVKTDPEKVRVVREWPVPCSVSEVRGFVGLCTYYRRFIKDFARIATPLHELTRKGARFHWSEQCQGAFDELKEALSQAPVLPYPDPTRPYVLDCDASAEGVGAVLSQEKEGKEWVVAYFSKKFTPPERNYCVTRKELLAVVKSVDHFHPYLYGARFKVRTDHAALRWLKTLKNPEGQLARWIGKIEQHDYEIEHRQGRVHGNADSLSRRPCPVDCTHCSRCEGAQADPVARVAFLSSATEWGQDLSKAQREDADIGPIVALVEESDEKPPWESVAALSPAAKVLWQQWEVLRVSDGVLQRKWESNDGNTVFWQSVIPVKLREELVREAHGGSVSGHFGVKKTLGRLTQRVYWVGLRKDVREWCRACDVCCAKMGPGRKKIAPLQVYQVGAPMERVAVDIVGPFRPTIRGNRFLVVVMDYFTKWPEAYPLPNHEAATVAEVLVCEFFARFGIPGELHSDQGREFESAVFKECCQLLGVRKTRTTPLRPQSDGMVERFNRTLTQEMAKYCQDDQEDWDVKIPFLLMAYRSAVHEVTGYTPARLMCGRELRLPLDLVTDRPPNDGLPETVTSYAKALKDRLCDVHRQVRENLTVAGEAMKGRYDQRATAPVFCEGELVWLYNPRRRKGFSPKLQSPWEGPYTVEKVISAVTFRIRRGPRTRALVVHADRLWKVYGPGEYTWGPHSEDGSEYEQEDMDGAVGDVPLSPEEEEEGQEEEKEKGRAVGRPRRMRKLPAWSEDYVLE